MHKLHRWLLLALVSLGVAAGWTPAQAATLIDRNAISDSERFSPLTPEVNSPPEFGRCIKTVGGAYKDQGCTESAGAGEKNYEWYAAFGSTHPLEKVGFSNVLKEATNATLETVSKTMIVCEGESSVGKYTGNKTIGSVVVTFTSCNAFGMPCHSEGAAEGTVVTKTLEGSLGVEELAAEPVNYKIGESLYPIGHTGPLAQFTCSGVKVTITGALISPVTANSMKLTTQIKTKAAKGKQRPENFVGEPPEVLMTKVGEEGTPEQAGETLTTNQANEEKVEISSVL
jgi:hypothetical protein